MRSGFRFDPPQVEASAELRWLLWRAFGPAREGLTGLGDLEAEAVTDLARRFDLAARVGARTPPETLTSELGSETAGWFRKQHAGAAARFLMAGPVCRELAEAGRLLETPLVFLKGAALQLGGMVAAGSRNMGGGRLQCLRGAGERAPAPISDPPFGSWDRSPQDHPRRALGGQVLGEGGRVDREGARAPGAGAGRWLLPAK